MFCDARCEAIIAVQMSQMFRDVTPCSLIGSYRRFGGMCWLHLQHLIVEGLADTEHGLSISVLGLLDTEDGGSILLRNVATVYQFTWRNSPEVLTSGVLSHAVVNLMLFLGLRILQSLSKPKGLCDSQSLCKAALNDWMSHLRKRRSPWNQWIDQQRVWIHRNEICWNSWEWIMLDMAFQSNGGVEVVYFIHGNSVNTEG
jgi:hypothetical protein